MKNKTLKNYFKIIVKLSLTIAALYFVFKKIELERFVETIRRGDFYYFFLALLTFNVSKLISAFRLNNFFKCIGLSLSTSFNLRLYWVGMFYNLFLPGSIGGDGYKVYLLHQFSDIKLKSIIAATFLDRTSGMVFLLFIAIVLTLFSSFTPPIPYFNYLLIFALISSLPVYYFTVKFLFPKFLLKFFETGYQAFLVQIGQVICALCLLLSLGVTEGFMDYLALFMIASVASVLPITIGGVGLREAVVLVLGTQYFHINETTAVAFTLSFFIVTACTSLMGLFFLLRIDKRAEESMATNSPKALD